MKEDEKSLLVWKPDLEKVRHLLSKGVDPNCASTAREYLGSTPLINAVNSENTDLVKILLDGGADPNFRWSCYIKSPLCWAAWYSNTTIVKMLLDAGADPNNGDYEGGTPLHRAVRATKAYPYSMFKGAETVEMLLGAGANPNKADNHGQTPLDLARKYGKDAYHLVKQLLDAGGEDWRLG